jgi:hypothetical protein
MLMCYIRRTRLPVSLRQLRGVGQEASRHLCYGDVEVGILSPSLLGKVLMLTWSNERCPEVSDLKPMSEYYLPCANVIDLLCMYHQAMKMGIYFPRPDLYNFHLRALSESGLMTAKGGFTGE